MTTGDVDAQSVPQILVGISFPDTFRAQEFLTASRGMAARGVFALRDAVLVRSDDEGRTVVQETVDLAPGPAALSGALWAGLFGLVLGGPVGWVAGLAVGAGSGALAAKVIDHGISDEWVGWFRQAVTPGSVIVALLVEDLNREGLVDEVARFTGAELVYANLEQNTIDRIKHALEG